MRNALVTLSVGQHGADCLAISEPLLREWAARMACEFIVIRRESSPFPVGEKFRVRDVVREFDRTVYADADMIPDPKRCAGLLDLVPADCIGAFDDWPNLKRPVDWVQREHDHLCDSQNEPRLVVNQCLNSGLLVLSRQHAPFFEPPKLPYPNYHCAEQWWEWVNAKRAGYKVHLLDEIWNYQWWVGQSMPSVAERPDILIRHFAGMKGQDELRAAMMRKAVAELV